MGVGVGGEHIPSHTQPEPVGGPRRLRTGGGHRRSALRALLLAGMALLLATPATAQESPTPPPSPTSNPSPDPSPVPSPGPTPTTPTTAPAAPDSQAAPSRPAQVRPEARKQAERKRRRERRRERHRMRERRRVKGRERIDRGCSAFTHTQTYLTWGPALAYSEPVTVAYQGDRCTRGKAARAEVTVEGTATVYQGALVEGEPIDVRPFRLSGAWERPSNEVGWPLAWWGCGVKNAAYRWEIPGVYVFDVMARWGLWTLTVSTQPVTPWGESRTVHWSYNGCRST
jgi:hypothetical protein